MRIAMAPSPLQPKSQHGFSVIELLVVLVIVSILSYVGMSSLTPKSPGAVKSLTLQIRGILNEARELAISSGRTVTVQANWNAATRVGTIVLVDETGATKSAITLDSSALSKATPDSAVFNTTDPTLISLTAASTYGFGSAAKFSNHLFNSTKFQFAPNGYLIDSATGISPTNGVFVGVKGMTANRSGVPVGVVLVTTDGRVISFFKPDAVETGADYLWKRLE